MPSSNLRIWSYLQCTVQIRMYRRKSPPKSKVQSKKKQCGGRIAYLLGSDIDIQLKLSHVRGTSKQWKCDWIIATCPIGHTLTRLLCLSYMFEYSTSTLMARPRTTWISITPLNILGGTLWTNKKSYDTGSFSACFSACFRATCNVRQTLQTAPRKGLWTVNTAEVLFVLDSARKNWVKSK